MNIAERYHAVINWIGDGTGLPDAILHVHAGIAVLMITRLVTRRSLGTFIPFALVVAAEGGNEIMDFFNYGWRLDDTILDIANTLFWPLVISLGVRLRPLRESAVGRDDNGTTATDIPDLDVR